MSALEELSSIELQVSSAHKTQLSCFCVCIGMLWEVIICSILFDWSFVCVRLANQSPGSTQQGQI